MLNLRGHHIFCTALFSGHGYDEAFSERMTNIIKRWQSGEAAALFEGSDEVCRACPNRQADGGCELGTENAANRDAAALRVLGLSAGERLEWKRAGVLLSEISESDFQAVCGECMWQREGLCSFQLLQKSARSRV